MQRHHAFHDKRLSRMAFKDAEAKVWSDGVGCTKSTSTLKAYIYASQNDNTVIPMSKEFKVANASMVRERGAHQPRYYNGTLSNLVNLPGL
eukprot:1158257-Pelagomonas_calceolata.AAC.4